jgi:DNA-binding NarL/FixJ family response regulator
MKLLLYDDHSFVTEAISKFFAQKDEAIVIHSCHRISDTLEFLKNNEVDILISDILSDEDEGLTLFEKSLVMKPQLKIIAYTSITNEFVKSALLEMGVMTIVNKKEPIETLYEITLTEFDKNKGKKKSKPSIPKLTKREKEISQLMAKGLAAKEIADILGSSPNTINNQKNRLLEKFECTNSTELVVKLAQMGLMGII